MLVFLGVAVGWFSLRCTMYSSCAKDMLGWNGSIFEQANKQRVPTSPAYIPAQTHFDRKPFLATDSCAIFEFSKELPGPICDAATIV